MRYSVLVGLLSLSLACHGKDLRTLPSYMILEKEVVEKEYLPDFERVTNSDGSAREVYRDDYNNDGKVDSIMTSTFSGNTRIDEADINADGKTDIRCIMRYLDDGRIHIRFDGDSDSIFEDEFYYVSEDIDL